MITFLHGDNVEASRGALLQKKGQFQDAQIRSLAGGSLTVASVEQVLTSTPMWQKESLVVLENFLSKSAKRGKATEQILTLLVRYAKTANIVLWEEKEIDTTYITRLGQHVHTQLFKIPVTIFSFLESIKPHNRKVSLVLFRKTVENQPAELVFTLLVRRIRQLLILATGTSIKTLASWQQARLTRQGSFFTMEKLRAMYQSLLVIDTSLKKGTSAFSLSTLIEQFLLDI